MKTNVFRFPSGFWGVRVRLTDGWSLWSVSCPNKETAIHESRLASLHCPGGRLYQKEQKKKPRRSKTGRR